MKKAKNARVNRIKFVYGMVVLALSSLLARLGYVQIERGESFRARSTNTSLARLEVLPTRGRIYDANANLLAYDQPAFSIILTRLKTKGQDFASIANRLAPVLKMKEQDLYEILANKDPYTTHARVLQNATPAQLAYVQEHQSALPGIDVLQDPQRVYSYGNLAGHVLGFVNSIQTKEQEDKYRGLNYSMNQNVGQSGLEAQYEAKLQGTLGYRSVEINTQGVPLRDYGLSPEPIAGENLQLTIDGVLQDAGQKIVVDELQKVKQKYGYDPRDAEAVVLDVKTGGVLALISYPYYDPNWLVDGKQFQAHAGYLNNAKLSPMVNNVLQSPRAPGSTVKPVNVLAGLESGVIRATTSISDPGFAWIGTYQMRDWAVGGHGIVDPVKAIQQSCDTFMYTLGMWLGNWYNNKTPNGTTLAKWQQTDFVKGMNTLYTWEQKFGLGAATGIDLPEEVQGRFYVDDSIHRRIVPYDLDKAVSEVQTRGSYNNSGLLYDLASAAIGQMQQFTPMELAQYVMTIANGGKRLQPHVLKAIYKPGETPGLAQPVQEVKPIVQDQIKMQAGHLKVVQQGMYAVCNLPGGTAYGSFHNAPYHAAGKTGTAEYPEDGAMKNISEFIAYAPADHPQVAIVVRVPGGGESGETAVPIGRQLLDVYFQERHQFFPREQWKDGKLPNTASS